MQEYDKFYFEEGKAILAGENEEYENNKHLFSMKQRLSPKTVNISI